MKYIYNLYLKSFYILVIKMLDYHYIFLNISFLIYLLYLIIKFYIKGGL